MYIKRIVSFLIAVFFGFSVCACAKQNVQVEPIQTENVTPLFQISEVGGYKIVTDKLSCITIANGAESYMLYESHEVDRKIECFATTDKLIILDTSNGITKYTVSNNESIWLYNPISTIVQHLNSLGAKNATIDVEIVEDVLYQTFSYPISQSNQKLSYIVSTVSVTWIDGKEYNYKYYDYTDGSTYISDSAPQDLKEDASQSIWVTDIENQIITNSQTNEKIPIKISNIMTGYGEHQEGQSANNQKLIAYINQHTGLIDFIVQQNGEQNKTIIQVLNNCQMPKLELKEQYIEMTQEESNGALFMVQALYALI